MNGNIKYAIIGAGKITSATVNGINATIGIVEEKNHTDIGLITEPYIIRNINHDISMIKPPKFSHRRNYKYHK